MTHKLAQPRQLGQGEIIRAWTSTVVSSCLGQRGELSSQINVCLSWIGCEGNPLCRDIFSSYKWALDVCAIPSHRLVYTSYIRSYDVSIFENLVLTGDSLHPCQRFQKSAFLIVWVSRKNQNTERIKLVWTSPSLFCILKFCNRYYFTKIIFSCYREVFIYTFEAIAKLFNI